MKRFLGIFLAVVLLCLCVVPSVGALGALTTSEECIKYIKEQEGFLQYKIWDHFQYSIGHGSACGANDYPNGITYEEADVLMRKHLYDLEALLDAYIVQNGLAMSQGQYDALMSFTYNVGATWMNPDSRISEMLINARDGVGGFTAQEFASALSVWCHMGGRINEGLIARRIRETQMFLYNDYTGENSQQYAYLIFEGNGGSVRTDIAFFPKGRTYGELQTPALDGCKFLGWYTWDGSQITPDTVVTEDHVVTAKWKGVSGAEAVFSDVTSADWYYNYVDSLYAGGIVGGYPDATFRPSGNVKLGEALKLILLACGYAEQPSSGAHWADGYRTLASTLQLLPDAEMENLDLAATRAQIAMLSANALKLGNDSAQHGVYADTEDPYALALYGAGIMEGSLDSAGVRSFYPKNAIKRSEISAVICRIRDKA